jgi:hypothetical protein
MKKPKVNSCPDDSELGAKQVSSPHYRDETTERAQWKGEKPADTRKRKYQSG